MWLTEFKEKNLNALSLTRLIYKVKLLAEEPSLLRSELSISLYQAMA